MNNNAVDIGFVEDVYLSLQTIVQQEINNGRMSTAINTDSLRARLRNKISSVTGEDGQTLQERIEESATINAKI